MLIKIKRKKIWRNRGHYCIQETISDQKTYLFFNFGHPLKKRRGQGTCAQQGTQQLKFRGPLSREGECNLLRRAMFGKFVFSRIALLCLIAIYILDHRTISIVFKKIRGKGYLIWKNVFWKFWSYICYTKIALELPQIYLRIFLKLTGQNVYLTPLRQIKNTSAAPLTDKFVR